MRARISLVAGYLLANTLLFVSQTAPAQRGPLRLGISPAPASMPTGHNYQLKAQLGFFRGVGKPGGGRDIASTASWTSSQTSVANVTSGLVSANQQGTTTISTAYGRLRDSSTVTVTPQVASISIAPATPSAAKGLRVQFSATATYTDSTTGDLTNQAIWMSSSLVNAVIGSSGLAATRNEGTTTISADIFGASASTLLTINPPELISISVFPQARQVQRGAMQQFGARGQYTDGSIADVTGSASWSSSDPAVADIDPSGKVRGVAVGGPAIITGAFSGVNGTATLTVVASGSEPVPQVGHLFILVLENTDYDSVVGNAVMPFLNALLPQGATAATYFANTHPSIDNYFMMTTGQFLAAGNSGFCGTVIVDNFIRRLIANGRTWKSYAEDVPSNWLNLCLTTGLYVNRHNPFTYFSDVRTSSTQQMNIVAFPQFVTDLNNGVAPNFAFLLPNQIHNAHDCAIAGCSLDDRLSTADIWLASVLPPLLNHPAFQQNGLLIVTFDEAQSDSSNGGGRVLFLIMGPRVKDGYTSTTLYQHQSLLRLMLRSLGVTSFPGASHDAPDMGEFFQ